MSAVVHPMFMHFLTAPISCTIKLSILINNGGTMFLYFQLCLYIAVTMSYYPIVRYLTPSVQTLLQGLSLSLDLAHLSF